LPAALSIIKGYMASVMPVGDATASVLRTATPPADAGLHE